jgi:hypothetical protein
MCVVILEILIATLLRIDNIYYENIVCCIIQIKSYLKLILLLAVTRFIDVNYAHTLYVFRVHEHIISLAQLEACPVIKVLSTSAAINFHCNSHQLRFPLISFLCSKINISNFSTALLQSADS